MSRSALLPRSRFLALSLFLALGCAGSSTMRPGISAATGASTYHVAKTFVVGGEGGWDYMAIDTARERLYLSHGTRVEVFDLLTDTVMGQIPNTPGVHGIAIAYSLGRGFTSNGRDSTVRVFNLNTLATLGTLHVPGRNPDAIYFDDKTGVVLTFNGGSNSATAFDAISDDVLGTLDLGGKPEFARGDGTGRVFVNIEDKSEVVAFNARSLKIEGRWPLAPCEAPSGMAIDPKAGRLFIGCDNKMMAIMSTKDGRVLQTVPIGEGVDANAFDPATGLAFSSNGEGTITVVREDTPGHFVVASDVPTARGARTMTVDTRTHRLYTVTADFGPPPEPTADRPHPRASIVPGTFRVIVLEP